MSETKFSKGPWSASLSCVMAGGETLCAMVNGTVLRNDDSEDYANAALISAAPEMYDLLDEISDGLLEAGGYGNCALARRIEDLLSKARGKYND